MHTPNSQICQCIHSYHSNALKHSCNTKGVFITDTFKYAQFYYTPSNKHTIDLHSGICTFTIYHMYYSYELMRTNPPHMHHPHILYILSSTCSLHPHTNTRDRTWHLLQSKGEHFGSESTLRADAEARAGWMTSGRYIKKEQDNNLAREPIAS